LKPPSSKNIMKSTPYRAVGIDFWIHWYHISGKQKIPIGEGGDYRTSVGIHFLSRGGTNE